MTPTSSSSTPISTRAARRSRRHLAATFVVAVLAAIATVTAPQSTGALYTASAESSLTGFQVQPLCVFESYASVSEVVGGLDPAAQWGFAPETPPAGWTVAGDPAPVPEAPDGTLLCDDGVLELTAGQSVTHAGTFSSPTTTVLVMSSPTSAGALVSFPVADGGADVVVDGTAVSLRTWTDGADSVTVATGALDAGPVHVLAVAIDGNAVTLWVDGVPVSGLLPAELTGLGESGLGLGTLAMPGPNDAVPTATFTATEIAVVGRTLTVPELDAIVAAAVPGA